MNIARLICKSRVEGLDQGKESPTTRRRPVFLFMLATMPKLFAKRFKLCALWHTLNTTHYRKGHKADSEYPDVEKCCPLLGSQVT